MCDEEYFSLSDKVQILSLDAAMTNEGWMGAQIMFNWKFFVANLNFLMLFIQRQLTWRYLKQILT